MDLRTTLGLALFVEGRILEVSEGAESVAAEWPAVAAPYLAPSRARDGYVGLAYSRRGVALWYVTAGGSTRLAGPVAQGFGVSPNGRRISFGRADLSRIEAPSRLTILRGPNFHRVESVLRLDTFGAGAGAFVGELVFVGWGDGGRVVQATWDPRSGELSRLRRFTRAGPAHPVTRQAVMYYGDGGCWTLASWIGGRPSSMPRSSIRACTRGLTYSPSGRWLAGIHGEVDGGFSGGDRNRLVVIDSRDGREVFRTALIPGAYQAGWEDESHVLVLARTDGPDVSVHRCNTRTTECRPVWSIDASGERYGVWLVAEPLLGNDDD